MRTDNFYLKEIEPSDIENIHKGLSNQEVTKYYDVHYETLEATKEQMDWYASLKKNGTGIWWGIYGKADDQFYGAGGFNDLERQHEKAEIGMWLLKKHWGKGILQAITPLLLEQGFNNLGLNRIEAYVVSDNLKCKKALEKVNITYEGTMREGEIVNGEKIDFDMYAILKRDWK